MADPKTPDPRSLEPYARAGRQLIPLHPWDSTSVGPNGKQRHDGKRPQDTDWTTRPYGGFDAVEHMRKGGNVGVRLTAEDLVIDWDPRNDVDREKGLSSYIEFVLALGLAEGLNPDDWPTVETGSGGLHHYLRKPADLAIVSHLPEYPGLEFKTRGSQVVAAGSVHPVTGRRYAWGEFTPSICEAVQAPAALLDAIARPMINVTCTESGVHTPEELARMLSGLDPEDFRDQSNWLQLMQACHHATGGEGREEFFAWSTSDPAYAGDETITRRWDSLSTDRSEGVVTYRTLHKLLVDAGREDLIPRVAPEDDFDDDLPVEQHESSSGNPLDLLVKEMNEQFCAVLDGGGFSVFMRDQDPAFGRPHWVRLSRESFRHYFEDDRVPMTGSSRERTKAEIWLAHPRRRKYRGIVMDPEGIPENRDKLNLWQGWAVQPEKGDWSLMREHIEEVLCDGNAAASDYVQRWIAFMLQRPWQAPETAIAFRGAEGTGKGTLGKVLMRIAGTHGLTVASPSQLAGRFNSHLRDCVFLFADEAVWPGDKSAEGTLKQLITEPVISFEAKGKDLVSGRNMIHLMLASNEEWVVPAGRTARRFFVQDVSDRRRNDRGFFERLWHQMDNGGLSAMVHDLLNLDLSGWHPSRSIPQTQALADQKLMSLGGVEKFWLELLSGGQIPVLPTDGGDPPDWASEAIVLGAAERAQILGQLEAFLVRRRIMSVRATAKALMKVGRELGVTRGKTAGGSERTWTLPPLPQMRDAFEKMVGSEGLFD